MKRVLFTRPLSDFDLDLCRKLNIEPVVRPLISIRPISVGESLREGSGVWGELDRATAVAFTSQHAVDALFGDLPPVRDLNAKRDSGNPAEKLLTILQRKPVYTVGEATADSLDEFGIMARFPEDYNGTVLAEMMQYDGVHTSVIHFCGNIRRPEFYDEMTKVGIDVVSVIVYEKTNTKLESDDLAAFFSDIDAVAFYSPSAVESFWDQNLHTFASCAYFAIGHTTLASLETRGATANVPRIPTSELLIREIGKQD